MERLMVKRLIIPFLILSFMMFPIFLNQVNANEAEAKLALAWPQYLPLINAARSLEGLPALSGNFRADFFTMIQECNNGVEGSCAFLKSFYAAANRNRGISQPQQFSGLPLQGTPYSGLGNGMLSMPISPSDDYEAIGIHGEHTTRANRDAQIRRSTPNYNLGSGK
jgi:hypothetical protein